jgi:N-acetylglucosaminyldiphosphoundecaprenol N-acetyl-beta-D-mannosaminyltransferase
MKTIPVLGIPFDALTTAETLSRLQAYLNEPRNHIIVTPNPEGLMEARRNPTFRRALLEADLRLADGTGVVLASRLRGPAPLPERVRGLDTTQALFHVLSEKKQGFTVYFLGGKPGVAEKAKVKLEAQYPALSVAGYHHGYFNAEEEKQIIKEINELKPDILLVCLGMPRQEMWASENRGLSVRLTLCLGGTLDILSGQLKPTPPILRKMGLEWLHRLAREPSRAKRMMDLPRFVWAIVTKL